MRINKCIYQFKRWVFVNLKIKMTSQSWQHIFHEVEILDPDGWNRYPDEFDEEFYSTKITYKEYEKRLINSTVKFNQWIF